MTTPSEIKQRGHVFVRNEDDAPPPAAVTPIRATLRDVLLTPETDAPRAPFARTNLDDCLIDKHVNAPVHERGNGSTGDLDPGRQ